MNFVGKNSECYTAHLERLYFVSILECFFSDSASPGQSCLFSGTSQPWPVMFIFWDQPALASDVYFLGPASPGQSCLISGTSQATLDSGIGVKQICKYLFREKGHFEIYTCVRTLVIHCFFFLYVKYFLFKLQSLKM